MNLEKKLHDQREIIEAAFEERKIITPENAGEELWQPLKPLFPDWNRVLRMISVAAGLALFRRPRSGVVPSSVIVKRVDQKTRSKTRVNELLRAGIES